MKYVDSHLLAEGECVLCRKIASRCEHFFGGTSVRPLIFGHHINSVNGSPELAGDPNNIKFVEGQAENLAEHGGNFQNPTTGELLNRSLIGLQALDVAVNAVGSAYQSSITGINEGFGGLLSIGDPAKAAVTLDGASFQTYGFWTGKTTGSYDVRDGQYIDTNTNKAIDPAALKGKLIRPTPDGGGGA